MIIPHKELTAESLQNLLEDIVSRDGTDYGYYEVIIESKIEQVRNLLETKQVYLCFDEKTETCSLLSKEVCLKMGLL